MFENIGDATLVIKKVRTSCGCAAALVSEKRIKPGGSGEIKVTLDSRGYGGRITKYVYVETNDPLHPKKQLSISAEIDVPPQPKIDLDRYSLDLGLVLEQDDITSEIEIINKGDLELKASFSHRDARFYHKNKEIKSKIKIAAGQSKRVTLRIPARKKSGLMREYIVIKSNDPMRPNLSVFLSGYVLTLGQLKELFEKYKDILE